MIRTEHGTGLIEVLILGGLVVALVLHAGLSAARLQAAGEAATEAAQLAAETAARHGTVADAIEVAGRLAPEADVTATRSGDEITVVVAIDVPLIGPENSPVSMEAIGRATARISPYRSGHG
jgi:hypothetical protein